MILRSGLLLLVILTVASLSIFPSKTVLALNGIDIKIYNDRPTHQNFFLEGEPMNTNVQISNNGTQTKTFYANFTYVSMDNPRLSYSFVYPQTLEPRSSACLCPLLTLPASVWKSQVDVRDGTIDGNQVANYTGQIYIKGAEFGVIEKQAKAEEQNAFLSLLNVIVSPLSAVGAAVGAVYLTFRKTRDLEKRKEQEFSDRIRALVRYELGAYRTWLNSILTEGGTWDKKSYVHDRYVTSVSKQWADIDHLMRHTPRQYVDLPIETKAKVFPPESLQKIEDAYQGFSIFLQEDVLHDIESDDKVARNRIHFDKSDADTALKKIEVALNSMPS